MKWYQRVKVEKKGQGKKFEKKLKIFGGDGEEKKGQTLWPSLRVDEKKYSRRCF